MKKTIATFLAFILLFSPFWVFGEGDCAIESSPPEELTEYITNTRTIISNITNNSNAQSSSIKKGKSSLLRSLNSLISWGDYKTEFEFFLVKPLSGEIPYQVKRDDKFLAREIDKLNKYLGKLVKTGHYNNKLSGDVCRGFSNCNFENMTAGEAATKILGNTQNIRHLLQFSAVGHPGDFDKKLILVEDNFRDIIIKNYGVNAIKACSETEDGFFKQIKDAIGEISLNSKQAKEGIAKWKQAWNLLIGNVSVEEYAKQEKELLKKELARQGVNSDNTKAILQNLDDYNHNGGYTANNNPITNSFNHIKNSINRQWNAFKQSISDVFGKDGKRKITTIEELTKTSIQVDDKNNIRVEIEELYKSQLPLAQAQDLDTKNLVGQIIKMHSNLATSINILEKTIPISQKVCNDQAYGKGKCEY